MRNFPQSKTPANSRRFGRTAAATAWVALLLFVLLSAAGVAGEDPVVSVAAGQIRGRLLPQATGGAVFNGIPFAQPPMGNLRWREPQPVKPWTGIRDAGAYGAPCAQVASGWNDKIAALGSEDCLYLNVWTPKWPVPSRLPVMVWIHGGANMGGSAMGAGGIEPPFDGEKLAFRGAVVVTINHRLGALGYLDLSSFGEKYAGSGNAGVLDLVLALEWVRDNIANFGGDPGNVLIFGQSGGGAKVSSLLAMPSAKGLFHKAVVQSGAGLRMGAPEDSAKLAAAVVAELGLNKSQLQKLHEIPVERLIEAQIAAGKKMPAAPPSNLGAIVNRAGWGPVVDGKILPNHPFDPAAPAISAQIPMLIGTVMNESSPSMSNPQAELLPEEEMNKQSAERFGTKSAAIIEAARKIYPKAKPVELLALITRPRTNAILQATRKVEQGAAPAYLYLFAWQTPILDGRPRAFHCSEIPFVFYNADVSAFATGGGPEPRELAAKVSDAWINFARKGDPNHSGLPQWPVFSADKGPVMVFDKTCEVKNNPDRELRQLVTQA